MKNIVDHQDSLLTAYQKAKRRILFLDYDGTLVSFKDNPEEAVPSAEVRYSLQRLGSDPRNAVILVSGRKRETLEDWLGNLPIILAAEHGGFYKAPGQPWKSPFSLMNDWKQKIAPAINSLAMQYQGTQLEHKHYSLAWNYRRIADQIAEKEMNQIVAAINSLSKGGEFMVYEENGALELRTVGINKGRFASLWVSDYLQHDFLLAIGDGRTDEDLFKALENERYSIRVGYSASSAANFFIANQQAVIRLLNALTELK